MTFLSSMGNALGSVASLGGAVATGLEGGTETEAFIKGMQALTAESNKVQMQMGLMNLQKTMVEGFAKFVKDMGKGFIMQ